MTNLRLPKTLLEFSGVHSFAEETMPEDYDMESSSEALTTELEEGEVLQDAELVCVNQEDIDRLAAEGSYPSLFP